MVLHCVHKPKANLVGNVYTLELTYSQINHEYCSPYWSLAGSLKSFQPSGAIISVMDVKAKTTRENGRHARPSHILPVPPTLQFTNANPVFSSPEALPCAVTAPFMPLDPGATGFAMETNWQFCSKCVLQGGRLNRYKGFGFARWLDWTGLDSREDICKL